MTTFGTIAPSIIFKEKCVVFIIFFTLLGYYSIKQKGTPGLRFKLGLIYILFVFAGLFTGLPSYAQKKGGNDKRTQQILDSVQNVKKAEAQALKLARERSADSAKAARERITDSTTAARKRVADSIAAVRDRRADSMAAVRSYKESRRYKDSVEKERTARLDSVRTEREQIVAAQKAERDRISDSVSAIRDAIRDSIKIVQTRRSDSLMAIKKYRESKRYTDSVDFVRQKRADSMATARKHINDSTTAFRQKVRDSTLASRKQILDSTVAARKVITDSLTALRKVRADSLADRREKREKLAKDALKKREQKMNLALEMKIQSKQKAWSNEKMLKKKWSAPRQLVQNSFTRYNYYFNAHNKMREADANMERVGKENLDSFIALYPFNPNLDSALIAPDMDSIIHKVSLGIQIHDPRTKWADDLYLLLGQAYYYKGDYKNASTAFRYIIGMEDRYKKKKSSSGSSKKKEQVSILEEEKESAFDFLKHKSVNNDAILWLSRTFVRAGQPENAEAVLDLVASDPKFPENLKGRLAMEKAFLMLHDNNMKAAGTQLQTAADDPYLPDDQRQRAAYLGAQILQAQNEYAASTENFQKALDLHPAIEMDFYARKNIAINAMASGEARDESISSLKKILKDYKYTNYYEQVYFLLGQLSSKSGKSDEALVYLQKSISSPKSTKKQKAISFAALGDIHYLNGDYVAAKSAYDSSSMLFKYAPDDKSVIEASRRSGALASVTGPYLTIKNQDSLLAMSLLPEKEQRAIIRKHLKDLQRQREDSIFNAENAGLNNVNQNQNDFNQGGGAGWYFANATQMKKGQNEFKRIWGNRPAVDNWRRMSAIGFVSNGGNNTSDEELTDENGLALDENGLPTEDALLSLLPTSPEQKEKANKMIQKAYVDLSDAYITELEDYQLADRALDTLDVRYKQHEDKDRALYLHYLMSVRLSKIPESRSYAEQIKLQFPNSQYAALVKPTEDGAGLPTNSILQETVGNYYDATYALLIQRQFSEVLERVKTGRQRYKDPRYDKRFRVMEGVAYAGAGNYAQADTLLRDFIKGNANDTLRAWAESVLEYVNKNKPVTPKIDTGKKVVNVIDTNTVKAPPVVNVNKIDEKVEIAKPTAEVPPIYAYKPDNEHYVIVSFPGKDARATTMMSAIGDYNTFKHKAANLTSSIDMLAVKEGVVVTKKFANAATAKEYMNGLKATSQVFREYQSSEYQVFMISASNYQKLLADHSVSQYLNFYKFYYK